MKRICITIASLLAACSLAGCTAVDGMSPLDSGIAADVIAADDAQEITNGNTEESSSETSSGKSQNNEIAAELPKLSVKIKEWDEDKINELFIEPRTDLVHKEYPSDFVFNDSYDVYLGEEGEGKDAYWLVYENGRLLSETRRDFRKYGYGTLAAHWGVYSFGEYFDDSEIALFPKEDAISRTNALLDELGIKNYTEPDVYAITADKANALLDKEWKNKDGSSHYYEKWTADNEVYILSYSLEYNGVPLTTDYPGSYSVVGEVEDEIGWVYSGSHILAIVTKDEIISLEAFCILSDEYEVGESIAVKCTEEQALQAAMKHLDGKYEAVRILDSKIAYIPVETVTDGKGSITLVPMWKIDVSAYNEYSPMRSYETVFINVSTGEPLTDGIKLY